MCNSRLGKGVSVFASGSTRCHSAAQHRGQFKVNVNPFSHKLLIIILTSDGGDAGGSILGFFSSIRSKIKESCVTLYSDMSLIIND